MNDAFLKDLGLEVHIDPLGKSEAFFCLNDDVVVVDQKILSALKARLADTGAAQLRLCLHKSADAALHDMIIVQKRGARFDAHMHPGKEECYQILEGTLRLRFYDAAGTVSRELILGSAPGLPPVCRVRAGVWHSTTAESDIVVVHESRSGPFDRKDSLHADWD